MGEGKIMWSKAKTKFHNESFTSTGLGTNLQSVFSEKSENVINLFSVSGIMYLISCFFWKIID